MSLQYKTIAKAWPALLLSISIAMMAPLNGLAQEAISPSDRTLAEALFRDGRALMDAGKLSEACPKLGESHRLDPKAGTILNLAVCQEQLGQVAQAWASYVEAARFAARANQAGREKAAKKKAAELEAILSKLTIEMQGELKDFSIFIDGKAHSPVIVGTALPLDPGDHEVEVRAPGYLPFKSRVNLPKGPADIKLSVPLPLSPETPAASAAPPPAPPASSPPPISPPPPENTILMPPSPPPVLHSPSPKKENSAMRTGAYIAGGVGAAGIVLGSIFGIRTFGLKADGDKECDADGYLCSQAGLDAHSAARTSATVSTLSFGVGLAGVGTAVALWILSAPQQKAKANTSRLWAAPSVLEKGATLNAGGVF